MDNSFGFSFAPTPDNAAMGPRNGQVSGVPQAVQVLSLNLPKVFGARPVAPADLLTSQGGHGIDPVASAVLQTLLKTMRGMPGSAPFGQPPSGQPGSLPGGTAGPNPFPTPQDPWNGNQPPAPPPFTPKPHIVTQDNPPPPPAAPSGGFGGFGGAGMYKPPSVPGGRFVR